MPAVPEASYLAEGFVMTSMLSIMSVETTLINTIGYSNTFEDYKTLEARNHKFPSKLFKSIESCCL